MRKTFTIVEMLIAGVVMVLLVAGVLVMSNAGNKEWSTEVGLLDIHRQARQAMHGMVREARQSQRADITISSSGERIEFRIPQSFSGGSPTYYQPIYYYLANDQIIREHPPGTTQVLANDVTSLNFCFWDSLDCCDPAAEDCSSINALEVSLDAGKIVRERAVSFSIREEVRLRNE